MVTLGQAKATGMERGVRACAGAHVCARVLSNDKPRETSQLSLSYSELPRPLHVHGFCSTFTSPSSQSVCRDSHTLWL